jgi:peptidoglycan hydrolase CwlO-like protein
LNKYELIKYLIDLSATERREGLTTINQTLETFMATTNEKLTEVLSALKAFEVTVDEVDGDVKELAAKVAELAAQIPDNALVQEIADKTAAVSAKLSATAAIVPEPPVTPEPVV